MKKLRKDIHLTQKELAELAGISRASVSMYEKGHRNLPGIAVSKLAEIQLAIQQVPLRNMYAPYSSGKYLYKQKQQLERQLNNQIRKNTAEALRISLKMTKMQETYKRLSDKLIIIQHLKTLAVAGTREMSLLEVMEINVIDKLERCSPIRQLAASYSLALNDAQRNTALHILEVLQKKSRLLKIHE